MEIIVEYFSQMPSIHRTILLVSGLVLLSLVEFVFPFFKRDYPWSKHAVTNVFFTLTTALVNLPLAFLLVLTCDWTQANNFGVLQWISLPGLLNMIAGLLILDLISAYLIHYIQHHVAWMWQFHAVHHTDQHIDVTSGNRHHPGESVFRFVFTILAVFIAGAPIWMVLMYQTMSVVLTQFNHSNIRLPAGLDRLLKWIIVTPEMHRVHHHYRMPYSDTNYGNIFSVWDRLFKTYSRVDNRKLRFGLDTHMDDASSSTIGGMLKLPFTGYKGRIAYDKEEDLT